MRKIILLALTTVMMAGCFESSVPETGSNFVISSSHVKYEAAGCEYWIYNNGHGGVPIHAGNCRFCKERRQKELEELVEQLKK